MKSDNALLNSPIGFLKGVGPQRAELLQKELQIFTFEDLLHHYPFRHIDRTKFYAIRELNEELPQVQIKGELRRVETMGEGRKKRLVATLRDESGMIELVWFQHIQWVERQLVVGTKYIAFGKVTAFNNKLSMSHPEIEPLESESKEGAPTLQPVYPSTEKLKVKGLDSKGLMKMQLSLQLKLREQAEEVLPDALPPSLKERYQFPTYSDALLHLHFPRSEKELHNASRRLKFDELFWMQLRLLRAKQQRQDDNEGFVFSKLKLFTRFYEEHLPFPLTGAQKRVLKEIHADCKSGNQMNRLLQGDVGSGKTIVAFMTMLMALDNVGQAALMAPTEILARQHYASITEIAKGMGLRIALLTGSIKGKARTETLRLLELGELHILIGTHALIEDPVKFNALGLVVIDEQHRFGVEQRAKLHAKNTNLPPHILVMSATPIPRSLAMTLYGDLDVSIIDELPPGRKPVSTVHRYASHRLRINGFIREEISKGRQVYIVYPMIEESEVEALEDIQALEAGYAQVSKDFPPPEYQVSILHGKMKPADKDAEMKRFVEGSTQILVATTVIEVGVNVPNASLMVIENAERFGLAQLHQLRGRVGRGAEQSYCILLSANNISRDGLERLRTLCETNDGFKIAEADLRLRGPGNIEGKQQSGMLQLRLADLVKDDDILAAARREAQAILAQDPSLQLPEHQSLADYLAKMLRQTQWSKVG